MQSRAWQYYTAMISSWDAMYLDCKNAKKSISLEQYILENDELGQKFLRLFIRKAQQGLQVRVVCDPFGSRSLRHSPLIEKLKKAGGNFHFYQPLKWLHIFLPTHWFPRTHIKALVIDSKIVYIGGVCISQRMQQWRDTHLRLVGVIAKHVERTFDLRRKTTIPKNLAAHNFYYLSNRPFGSYHAIYKELLARINQAQKCIYIGSAFFVPNQKFLCALQRAARRGVDVRIIVTKNSDIRLADWVALSYLGKLISKKVRVFHYEKTVYHCKTVVIDDVWATVGSTNMDILSFFYNRESNVIIQERRAIAELKSHFFNDLKFCTELTKRSYAQVPLWKRALGFFARSLKIFFTRQNV